MKNRILIVDDSNLARRNLRSLLEPLDADITEAVNGREALERVAEQSYDLIITDIDMPEMEGIELCGRLKQDPELRQIPVIIVSSFDSDAEIEKGFQAGASEYIIKNEVRETLASTASKILTDTSFRRKLHILVVDDSNYIRKIVKSRLEKAGYEVSTSENGRDALELAASSRPDLLLSDIQMPVMDGFALCATWHADARFKAIPFVAMSTMSDRSSMNRILKHGGVSYVVKPFNLDQLVILLDKILSDQFLLLLKEKERLDAERDMMLLSITSLVSALEARDAYTRGHSENVAEIACTLAVLAGIEKDDLEIIRLGGKLHDIGKIGVRDNVLLKQGKLTEEEFKHIQAHPVIGAGILSPIPSISSIVPIVRHHHERWDGKGYPDGIAGNAIPLWARIMSVADVYDALTSDRPYRDGMSREAAVKIICDGRESQFCPYCVDLFMMWISDQNT